MLNILKPTAYLHGFALVRNDVRGGKLLLSGTLVVVKHQHVKVVGGGGGGGWGGESSSSSITSACSSSTSNSSISSSSSISSYFAVSDLQHDIARLPHFDTSPKYSSHGSFWCSKHRQLLTCR